MHTPTFQLSNPRQETPHVPASVSFYEVNRQKCKYEYVCKPPPNPDARVIIQRGNFVPTHKVGYTFRLRTTVPSAPPHPTPSVRLRHITADTTLRVPVSWSLDRRVGPSGRRRPTKDRGTPLADLKKRRTKGKLLIQ